MSQVLSYNERLFSGGGLRSYYHHARFAWARGVVGQGLGSGLKLVELGCFDGRLLEEVAPWVESYVGLDANWEGGLDRARAKFANRKGVVLIEATSPAAFAVLPDRAFDVAAALETIEHLPPDMVPGFLDQLARVTKGHLLVTVPNELGLPFLIKFVGKRLRYGGGERYSLSEFIAAVLRRSDRIARDDHKGFDYRALIREIAKRFDIVRVEGIPRLGLPPALSPTVGILARSRGMQRDG